MAVTAMKKTAPVKVNAAKRPAGASAPPASAKRVSAQAVIPANAGPVIKLNNPEAAKDPRFKKVLDKLERSASKVSSHPPAAKKAVDAQAAAKPPANERLAAAQSNQVDTMNQADARKPEPESFLALMRAEIGKVMPKTLGETEKFMTGEKKEQLKGTMTGNVNKQQSEATGGIRSAASQAPDPSGIPGKEVMPLPPEQASEAPPALGASEAMPAPKPEAEVSLQQSKQDAGQQLVEANVTQDQLKKANDPRFSAVLTAKSTVEKQVDSAPRKYRGEEQKTLSQTGSKAVAEERKGIAAFLNVKGASFARVKSRQQLAKEKDEAERKKVADTIENIFRKTKESVEKKLASLEADVSTRFDAGMVAALKKMTDYIDDRMFKWKLARYGSSLGLLWLKDKLLGLPDEVNVFYEGGRKVFSQELDRAIDDIANLVDARLKEAKDEIAKGQKEIGDYVKGLPQNLQGVGKAAEKEMAGRFDEMRRSVDDKKNDLAQNLAQRYKEAHDKAGEKLKEMQAENKGLLTSLKEKLGEVIKVLREFKERIMGMLKKGKAAIDLIIADPIGFLKNLLAALKQGFNQFVDKIWTHLKKGFMNWLFGALAKAGIEVPADLTLPSILKLVLGVLGITYEKMRAKAVKILGPTAVTVIEKVVEYVGALVKGGPAALWEKVKDDLGNLKEMVMDAIQDWLITTIIKKAVTKIVSMFNPVGAIVQAIIMIYDVVMFVIDKAAQLLGFVEAVVNSVAEIASGAIDKAAKWIEDSLGKLVPVVIGLLASLIGLGGISEKIREFILKVQDKVDKAIDKVIGKVAETVKKLFGAVKAGVKKFIGWWKRKEKFSVDAETHSLFFKGDAKHAQLKVASTEESLITWLEKRGGGDAKREKAIVSIKQSQGIIESLRKDRKPSETDGPDPTVDDKINTEFENIARELPFLFSSGKWGSKERPVLLVEYPKKSPTFYRTLYLGPRVKSQLSQSLLKSFVDTAPSHTSGVQPAKSDLNEPIAATSESLKGWIDKGGKIKAYKPFERSNWPDGSTHGGDSQLGVTPEFLLQTGSVFKFEKGATPGGKKLNEALKLFGYYGKKDGGENSDGDHILEAQLIGKDRSNVIGNMWPLDKTENRHGEHLLGAAIEIPQKPKTKEKTLQQAVSSDDPDKAKELWVMIKATKG